jgi:hypothetical protein
MSLGSAGLSFSSSGNPRTIAHGRERSGVKCNFWGVDPVILSAPNTFAHRLMCCGSVISVKSGVIHNLPLRRHKETRLGRSKWQSLRISWSICTQKGNDVGVISVQNSRDSYAGVAERRNVIARLRPGFGCKDWNSRCSEAQPLRTLKATVRGKVVYRHSGCVGIRARRKAYEL